MGRTTIEATIEATIDMNAYVEWYKPRNPNTPLLAEMTDTDVLVSEVFEIDGETYRGVLWLPTFRADRVPARFITVKS